MGLLTSIINTASAFKVFSQAMQTTENNVVNSSTPDFARQVATFKALPFDPSVGLPGGVAAGPVESTRSAFAEQAVRSQQSQLGYQQQVSTDLTQLQNYYDPSNTAGIPASLDSLFSSFSALSVSPNDTNARQAVITQAQQVAQSFQQTATGLGTAANDENRQVNGAVSQINQIASQIAAINGQSGSHAYIGTDAGVDASLTSDLEQLSQLVNFTALKQPDGTVTVYMGNQTPLVIGTASQTITATFSNRQTQIFDGEGNDVTSELTGGSLGGMLQVSNTLIPGYVSDLNTLAQSVADQVNTTLSNGVDQNGATPTTNLFSYDPTVGAATTLTVNPLTPDQIAAALPNAPGGNDNALALAQLVNATPVNGSTFDAFYGHASAKVGTDLSDANANVTTDQQLLTQSQTLRNNVSGVSLDQEAANLISFQAAYNATAKLLSVLNSLTETLMTVIPPAS